MRLVFHVGLPKTGTTTYQQEIFSKLLDIVYLGKTKTVIKNQTEPFEILKRRFIFAITQKDGVEFDKNSTRDIANEILAELRRNSLTSVWSNEALTTANRVDRKIVAERLFTYLQPDNLLISLRDPLTALKSQHHFAVRGGNIKNFCFPSWVEFGLGRHLDPNWRKIDPRIKQYRYPSLIKAYLTFFPVDTLDIVYLEDFATENPIFAKTIASSFGLKPSKVVPVCLQAARKKLNSAPSFNGFVKKFLLNSSRRYFIANSQLRLSLAGYSPSYVERIYEETRSFLMDEFDSLPSKYSNEFVRLGYIH